MSGGENNDSADDQSSILSRTPSPAPDDIGSLSKYDEYVRGTPREVITVETKIKPTNKGFAMLTKLGWSVGLSGDGRFRLFWKILHNLTVNTQVVLIPFLSR
jgi:hypothetical protein